MKPTTSIITILLLSVYSVFCPDSVAQWTPQTCEVSGPIQSVWFEDQNTGWAVGGLNAFTILHTSNGGGDWTIQFEEELGVFQMDICFIDSLTGWAVGFRHGAMGVPPKNIVLYTNNGGNNWEERFSGASHSYSVCFTSYENGWIAGGLMMQSLDGGFTWQTTNTPGFLYDVFFLDQDLGWAVGCYGSYFYGSIIHTIDGGVTWNEQISGAGAALHDVYFIDQNTGWVVGDNTILHTDNGGDNWQFQYNSGGLLRSVYFPDMLNGWVVGSDGLILHTTDGGNNWETQESGTDRDLYSVFFVDDYHGWIVGDFGTILYTDNGGAVGNEELQVAGCRLQVFPNPAFGISNISYQVGSWQLAVGNHVRLSIYDIRGKEIRTLVNQSQQPGDYTVRLDASDLPSRIYFVRLQAGEQVETVKMVVMR